jgi:heptosyltransferase-1
VGRKIGQEPLFFSTPPQRVLIIKPSAIGDIVHALPVLNLIRRNWPRAHVSWVVTPNCGGLLAGHPQIDELIYFERHRLSRSWRSPNTFSKLLRFARHVHDQRFDLVIDLQGLFRSGWVVAETKAPIRVGFSNARELGWLFYTHLVDMNWEDHAVDRNLCIAQALGLGRGPVEFHFAVDEHDRQWVSNHVAPGERYAVLLPGAMWDTKQWPPEHFARLVGPLRERFGLTSVLAGSPADLPLAQQIPGATNLVGQTNLRQLVALLERADLVIANDSGPMHIAAALGRPLVTLFGPTSATRTGPYGRLDTVVKLDLPCSPCYSRRCSHRSCLRWLEAEPVLVAAEKQLNRAPQTMSIPSV